MAVPLPQKVNLRRERNSPFVSSPDNPRRLIVPPETELITILLADDDEEDRMLAIEALEEARLANEVKVVEDGEELMDYLHRRGQYTDPESSPRPGLILLDLNMPKKDGRQALKEIKEVPGLRSIPVVVLTTSKAEEDILRTYDLGVNSFITKPVSFDRLTDIMKALALYWCSIVRLPN
ncbi:MAG: response regulator [Gammaproteobacteria bacterium]|nr:response regulator [Gammaproteobacteria bacterium]